MQSKKISFETKYHKDLDHVVYGIVETTQYILTVDGEKVLDILCPTSSELHPTILKFINELICSESQQKKPVVNKPQVFKPLMNKPNFSFDGKASLIEIHYRKLAAELKKDKVYKERLMEAANLHAKDSLSSQALKGFKAGESLSGLIKEIFELMFPPNQPKK